MIAGVLVKELESFKDSRGWLAEIFRVDEVDYVPVMAYLSSTRPSVCRGPHEHREQSDFFVFFSSSFEVKLWDNRPTSKTYQEEMLLRVGEKHPIALLVPPGVVHAYQNIGMGEGLVLNLPDRLYAGWGRQEEVDEIRHEKDPKSPFQME